MNTIPLQNARWVVMRTAQDGTGQLEATEMHGDLDLLYFAMAKNTLTDVARAMQSHDLTSCDTSWLQSLRAHIDSALVGRVATKLSA